MHENTMKLEGEVDQQSQSSHSRLEKVIQSIKKFATVSEVLRIFGAGIMVASMSVFLLQGWSEGNDIQRYLKLLTQTGLLAGAGFLLSYLLKENKGARLFFGLALISVPANFAILGGLIYSLFLSAAAGFNTSVTYPQFASWVVTDSVNIVFLLIGAMTVLIPVTLISIRIMARRSAGPISLVYLLLNSLLLIPFRDPWTIGMILAAAILIPGWVIAKYSAQDATLSTPEGKYALWLLLVPAGLIFGRSFYLYQFDTIMGFAICASLYILIRSWAKKNPNGALGKILVKGLIVPLAYGTAFFGADLVQTIFSDQWAIFLFAATLGLFMLDFHRSPSQSIFTSIVLVTTSLIIALSMLSNLLFIDTAITAIMAGIAGLGLIAFGVLVRRRLIILIGTITGVLALVFGLQEVIVLFVNSGWLALAVIGGIAIVSASLLDRYGAAIKLRVSDWSSTLSRQ